MGHLKVSERGRAIDIFNALPIGIYQKFRLHQSKYQKGADKAMHDYSIEISARSVRKQIYEWQHNQTVSDKQRDT